MDFFSFPIKGAFRDLSEMETPTITFARKLLSTGRYRHIQVGINSNGQCCVYAFKYTLRYGAETHVYIDGKKVDKRFTSKRPRSY